MRVLLVLVAFVAMPFAVGFSQGQSGTFSDPANCGKHLNETQNAQSARAARLAAGALVHGGIHGVMDRPCEQPPPPPPSGSAMIDGRVYNNSPDGRLPLAGWVVTANGTYSATTDENGNYSLAGLPAGTFAVCVVIPDGWVQQMPTSSAPCPNGMGYNFALVEGEWASFVNFAMVAQ